MTGRVMWKCRDCGHESMGTDAGRDVPHRCEPAVDTEAAARSDCPYPDAGCDGNGTSRLCESCPRRDEAATQHACLYCGEHEHPATCPMARRQDTEAAAVRPTPVLPTPLPCPFCGSAAIKVDRQDDVFRHVYCGDCGAHGPVHGSEDWDPEYGNSYAQAAARDAIEAWNAAPRRKGRRVAARGKAVRR